MNDWLDDAEFWGTMPTNITVTLTADGWAYTDFYLTPAQVRAAFEAIAEVGQ